MASTVTDIEAPVRGSRLRRIWLDHELWATTSAAVVKEISLAPDDIVDPPALRDAIDTAERGAARDRALKLLGYRERSAVEMRRKLDQDGYSDGVARAVVESLERVGLLDDRRFAESLVRTYLARGYGGARVRRELARAGIDDALAAEVWDDAASGCERDRALEVAQRLARGATDVRHLAARLARKGFGADIAFSVAREVLGSQADDDLDPR